jgi:hypothetical protein
MSEIRTGHLLNTSTLERYLCTNLLGLSCLEPDIDDKYVVYSLVFVSCDVLLCVSKAVPVLN